VLIVKKPGGGASVYDVSEFEAMSGIDDEKYALFVLLCCNCVGSQHGSVVRTSVFGWQTFPDLCLIYSRHVTTLLVN